LAAAAPAGSRQARFRLKTARKTQHSLAWALQPIPHEAKAPRLLTVSSELTRDSVMKAVFPALEGFVPASAGTASLAAKRAFDLVAGIALLLIFAPVMVLVSLAVALESPGPVLFCQKRTGRGGKTFPIFKFRSMRVMEKGGEVRQAVENDDRITRVGRVIRKLSLDELPQLFNVIAGQMSLVGPRPHAILHDDYYGARIPGYALRQQIKPGITGWAQVNGSRGPTPSIDTMRRRVALDAWYVANHSLALDIKILVRTPLAVLSTRNAH
jgi:putative colanic acid biosynthesis UDP-glucose lipid carrier transferase